MGLKETKDLDLANNEELLPLLELMLDQAYLGIVLVDPDGIIRFMNRQYEELIGLDRRETYGNHITEYFPDSRLPEVLRTRKAELGWKYNYQGKETLVVNRIPVIQGEKTIGAMTQCIFRDISELQEMAGRLELLETKVKTYKRAASDLLTPKYNMDDIKGASQSMRELKKMALMYAPTDSAVLITGETGTGKELFAHAIHHASNRNDGPLVCVNCSSIPEELLESELFGYATGAFTGARKNGKQGKIELAHGGTLFLDEIAELPLMAQAKLLRVLEEKRLDKIGEVMPFEIDFRIIAATNSPLDFLKNQKNFRQDLFHRLAAIFINITPLRERIEDVPVLVQHFLQSGPGRGMKVTERALRKLMGYSWPGNVRELRNALELAVCVAQNEGIIDQDQLPGHINAPKTESQSEMDQGDLLLKSTIHNQEVQLIKNALSCCRGNKARAAKVLGISRSSLYNKIKRYGIH
ncbi:MAG: sigma 54-interacting transcriptional regulator [Desulfohalobiaceae bacterium]|nr:sigma 54-interacting transcriptional regulator [Desulfohalobiaceae bacterium]